MKTKKILSIFVIIVILLTKISFAKDYSDYPQKFWDVSKNHWAYEYISELIDKNVISGYTDGSFKPEKTVSRAEWCKMLVIASGKQPVNLEKNNSYAIDYTSNDWYYGYINSVVDYINFYNDNENYYFKPNQSASREDVIVSLVKLKGYEINDVDYSYISNFKDSNSISNELKKYIAIAIEKELIKGFEDNTFRGQDTLSRAEAATLLCRAFQLGNDNKTTNQSIIYSNNFNINLDTDNEITKEAYVDVSNDGLSDSENSLENNDVFSHRYKIETLAKADIKNERYDTGPINFITMKDDNIYYLENDIVYVLNTNSKKRNNIMNTKENLEFNGLQYKITEIYNIFYDNNNARTLMYCYAQEEDIFKGFVGFKFLLIDVDNNKIINNEVSNGILSADVLSVDEDNNLWINKNGTIGLALYKPVSHMNNSHYMSKEEITKVGYTFDMKEINNTTYFLTNGGIYKYNYSEFKNVLETSFNPIASFDNGFIVQVANGDFKNVNFNGRISDYINLTDIEIKDKKSIKSKFMMKMFVNSKGDIVVYDLDNNCFRIICENK